MAQKKKNNKPKRAPVALEGGKKAKKKLTPKEAKFADFLRNVYINRMSEYEAGIKAGFSHSMARNAKAKIWGTKTAQQVYDKIIASAVNPDDITRNIVMGLNAHKIQFVGKEGRPEITPDLSERREWQKLLMKMQGIGDNDGGTKIEAQTINVIMPKE